MSELKPPSGGMVTDSCSYIVEDYHPTERFVLAAFADSSSARLFAIKEADDIPGNNPSRQILVWDMNCRELRMRIRAGQLPQWTDSP